MDEAAVPGGATMRATVTVPAHACAICNSAIAAWRSKPTTHGTFAIDRCRQCGFAFVNPSMNALISRYSDQTRQGEVLGVNQSASALARILGPTVGSVLFPLTERHELPYLVAAAFLFLVLAGSARLGGPELTSKDQAA